MTTSTRAKLAIGSGLASAANTGPPPSAMVLLRSAETLWAEGAKTPPQTESADSPIPLFLDQFPGKLLQTIPRRRRTVRGRSLPVKSIDIP